VDNLAGVASRDIDTGTAAEIAEEYDEIEGRLYEGDLEDAEEFDEHDEPALTRSASVPRL
jgi:hypothetical protein